MKKTWTITQKLLIATALVALVAGSADAASPKRESDVASDVVTLGDVFKDLPSGADAAYVLAPAPGFGRTLTLNAADLTRISNAFNLGWMADAYAQTVVRRDAHFIDNSQIASAVADKIEESLNGQKFDVETADSSLSLQLPPNLPATMAVTKLKFDLAKGDFRAVLVAPSEDNPQIRREFTGRLFALTSVPILSRSLRSGDVISADDIQYVDMRTADVAAATVVDPERLIGQTPRRAIAAMKPVSANDIELPTVVKKGGTVTMTLSTGAIQLTAEGRALQDGSVGDVVRVINTSSNQTVEARVTGDRTVAVKAPGAALLTGDNI